MTFLWSGLLLLLVLVPVPVVIYVLTQRRRKPSALRYSSLELIRAASPGSSRVKRHLPFAVFVAAIASLLFALARPIVVLAVPTDQTTIVLTIDVSGSMCSTDILPSRIQAAEAAAQSFIKGKASSAQIGLVAFSSFAEIVQAPTTNQADLLAALASLATGRRTAIGDGILGSIDAISEVDPAVAKSQTDPAAPAVAPVPKGDYAPDIVVLLTDGASNTGTDPLAAAQQAADRGVRVFTIGFGTANGGPLSRTCFQGREPGSGGFGGGGGGGGGGGFGGGGGGFPRGIDEATLQQIAAITGGKYYPASSADELNAVFSSLPLNLVVKHQVTEISFAFVGLGALLAGVGLLLGRAWRPLP
jgi:Ca-activated chloride channel homolog